MPYFNSQLYPLNMLILFLSCRPTSKELVGECWLQSARVARKAGHHQTAFNALLNAENTHLAELVSEKAKWLRCKVKNLHACINNKFLLLLLKCPLNSITNECQLILVGENEQYQT